MLIWPKLEENTDSVKHSILIREDGYAGIGSGMKLSELYCVGPLVTKKNRLDLRRVIENIDNVNVDPAKVFEKPVELVNCQHWLEDIEVPLYLSGTKAALNKPDLDRKVIILSQGLMAPKDCVSNKWMMELLHRNDICTLAYDYYSDKRKDVSIARRAEDLSKIIEYYKLVGNKVGCYGSSYGGLAFYWACKKLDEKGIQPDVIANRTILVKLNDVLSKDLRQNTGNDKYRLQYIWENPDEVVALLSYSGVKVSKQELKDVCAGRYNAGKVASYIKCPNLNVQGSSDEKVEINTVDGLMKEIRKNNKNNHFVELFDSDHGCGNNLEHYKIQLYLLSNFLIENLQNEKENKD